jgi:hypothetical protein
MADESSSLAKDVDDVFGSLLAAKPKYQQEEESAADKQIAKPLPAKGSATELFSQGLDDVIKMPAGYEQQQTPFEQLGPEAKKVQVAMDSEAAGTDPKKLREMQAKGEPLSETQLHSVFQGERNAPISEKVSDAASGFGHAVKELVWDDLLVGGAKTAKALAGVPQAMITPTYHNNPNATDEEARAAFEKAQQDSQALVDKAKDEAYKAGRSFTSGVVQGVEGLVNTGVRGAMFGSGLTDRIREIPGGSVIVEGMKGGTPGALFEGIRIGLSDNRPSGTPTGTFQGRDEIGNIDLENRPTAKNEDGSISTVRSMSFNDGEHEVLIPTVSPDGKILSDEDAIKLYRQTGQHLGKFKTVADADAYADALHKAQDARYSASPLSLPVQTQEESFENWRNREQMKRMEAEEAQQNPDRAAAAMAGLAQVLPIGDQQFRNDVSQEILDNQIKPDPNIAGFGAAVSPINPVVFGAGPLNKVLGKVVDKGTEGVLRAALKPTIAGMHPVEALGVGLQKFAGGTQTAAKRFSDFLTGSEDSAVAKAFDPLVIATRRPGMALEGAGRVARDIGRQIDAGGFRGRTGLFQRAGQDTESGNFVKTVFGQGAEKERPGGPELTGNDVENTFKPIRLGPTTAKVADWAASRAYGMNKHGLSGAVISLALGVPDIENAEQFGASAGSGYAIGAALSTRPLGKAMDILNPKTSFKQKVDSVLGKEASEQRADEDADIARFRATANPDILAQTDSFASQESHVAAWDSHIARLQQAKDELSKTGGDTKNADAQIAAAQKIRDAMAKASPEQFKEAQRRITLTVADVLDLAKTTGEAVGLNGLNVHFLDSASMPEYIMNKWGKTLTDATTIIDQLGDRKDLSQSENESLMRARETVAEVENQLQNWPNQRGFALSPNDVEEDTPAHLRMGNLQAPEIVVNADLIRSQLGSNLSHVLSHEILVHGLGNFKEVKALMKPMRDQLFGTRMQNTDGSVQEVSPGLISNEELDRMAEVYALKMGGNNPAAAAAWKSGFKNQEQLRDYMREEYLAELSGMSHNGNADLRASLNSPGQAISDWLAVQSDNSVVGRLRDMLGMKGVVLDSQGRVSDILGAELDPQALAMMRQFQRKLADLNRGLSMDSSKAADVDIPVTEAMTNRAVQEKTKDQDLWAKEQVYQVKDKDGNVIAEIPISNENEANPLVGEYRIENGYLVDEKGNMLSLTPELRNAAIPGDAKVSVESRILRNPDGSPKILTNREIRARARERSRLIREALDNAPQDGFEGRLEDIGNGVYRGTMSPSQIAAIMALPNRVVSPSLKRKIVQFNEVLQRKDGSRMIVEYQAALRGGGYKALSPRIRDLVPIGFHFSKDGNFLAVNMSVSRMFDKLNAWVAQKPENLNLWGRDTGKFWEDVTKVLANHAAGKPGETGLDVDPEVALQKKNRVNDFFNIFTKDTRGLNPDRTVLKTRRGQDSADRIIMSTRMDRINAMEPSNAEKLPVNYEKMKVNFMPGGNSSDRAFWDSARQTLSDRDAFETRDVIFNPADEPKPRRVLKAAPEQPLGDTPAFREWAHWNMEHSADAGYTTAQLEDFAAQNKFKSGVGKEFAQDAKERLTAKESDAIRNQLARDNGFEPQGEHEPNAAFRARIEAAKKDPEGIFNPKSPNYRMFLDWHGQPFTLPEQAVEYWTTSNSTSQHLSAQDLVQQHGLEQAMKIAADQSSIVGKNLYGSGYGLTPKTFTTEPTGHAASTISKAYYDLRSTPEALRHVELNGLIDKANEELRQIDYSRENAEAREAKEREVRQLQLEQADLSTRLSAMAAVKYWSEQNPNTALFSSADQAKKVFEKLQAEAGDTFKPGTKVYRGLLLQEDYDNRMAKRQDDATLATKIEKALAKDGYFDLPVRALTSWTQTEKMASTFSRHGQGKKDYSSKGTGIVITHEPDISEVVMHPKMPTYESIFAYRKANGLKFNSGGADQKEVVLKSDSGTFRLTPENTKFVKFMPADGEARFAENLTPHEAEEPLSGGFAPSGDADMDLGHEAFLDHLEDNYRDGVIPVSHSLPRKFWEAAQEKGYLGNAGDYDGVFGTLGNKSEFYSGDDRVHVTAHLPAEEYLEHLMPDMRYDDVQHFMEEHPHADGGDVYVNAPIPLKHIVSIEGAESKPDYFGTKDPYVYHLTEVNPQKFKSAGIRPSRDGYQGPGVYMANTPEATQYYSDLETGHLLRINKHDLVSLFGKYPENPDGVQYDHGTGEVMLSNGENVPPELIEYRDASGKWKSLLPEKSKDVNVLGAIKRQDGLKPKFMPGSGPEGLSLSQAEFSGFEPAALGGARVPNPMEPKDSPSAAPLAKAAAPGDAYQEKWDQARVVDGSEARPQDQKLFLVTVVKPNGESLEKTFPVRALTKEKASAGLKALRDRIFKQYQGKADLMITAVDKEDSDPIDWAALRNAAR